jgi:hypothetical protein
VRTDGHAAGGDEHVALEPALERGAMSHLVVGRGGERADDPARGLERGREHDAVRLVDLARPEGLARAAKLGARREHRDPRSRRARDLGQTGRGKSADLSGREHGSPRNNDVAHREVAAARAHVRAHVHAVRDVDLNLVGVVTLDNILDGDDGIGAVGHDAARRDLHRLAGGERAHGRPAGCDAVRDRQGSRRVDHAKREPVHRGARKRRQVDGGARVLGEHATGCRRDGHGLRRQRANVREHPRQRLLDREQSGHRRRILGP